MNKVQLIDSNFNIDSLSNITKSNYLAIDTEFMREKTFFAKLCLLQVGDSKSIVCIDALANLNLDKFWKLAEKKTWIIHSARQDLEVIFQTTNILPKNLFDTQIAAGILGLSPQIGYAKLVENFFQISLKKDQNLVSNIGAYITGSIDEGLLVISGKLNNGVSFEDLDAALWKELSALTTELVPTNELERLKIKIQTSKEFNDQGLLNRAMNLSMHELLGGAEKINEESEIYQKITPEDIQRIARETLNKTNCSLLKVKADNAE